MMTTKKEKMSTTLSFALPCSLNSAWSRRVAVLTSSSICCVCVPVPGSLQMVSLSIPLHCLSIVSFVCLSFSSPPLVLGKWSL